MISECDVWRQQQRKEEEKHGSHVVKRNTSQTKGEEEKKKRRTAESRRSASSEQRTLYVYTFTFRSGALLHIPFGISRCVRVRECEYGVTHMNHISYSRYSVQWHAITYLSYAHCSISTVSFPSHAFPCVSCTVFVHWPMSWTLCDLFLTSQSKGFIWNGPHTKTIVKLYFCPRKHVLTIKLIRVFPFAEMP